VQRVISLITLQLGNDMMVSVQAEMVERPSSRAMVDDINAVEAELKREFPNVRWSFFEPDIKGTVRHDQDYSEPESTGIA
jgi:divalent metal cation (Fe/Co/Zn/Cd) transporter